MNLEDSDEDDIYQDLEEDSITQTCLIQKAESDIVQFSSRYESNKGVKLQKLVNRLTGV